MYIVLDDVGFSAMSCYGGPIETPNIQRIAENGLRYRQFHTTALCSPTRSCFLTGRNHTRNSMACITEASIGFPNASGTIPPENGMLSEILADAGWNTYMVGKWHLCPTEQKIRAQMGFFAVAGASLYVGRHSGEPLTDDYPGNPPFSFTGGSLHQVTVNVSGEPYTALDHHAGMVFSHQ